MKYEYKYLEIEGATPEKITDELNKLANDGFEIFKEISVNDIISQEAPGSGRIKIILKAVFRKQIEENKEYNPHISQPGEIKINIKPDETQHSDT